MLVETKTIDILVDFESPYLIAYQEFRLEDHHTGERHRQTSVQETDGRIRRLRVEQVW